MQRSELNRRDFTKLSMAAFGGMVAGTVAGCSRGQQPAAPPASPQTTESTGSKTAGDGNQTPVAGDGAEENLLMAEPHVCRGLNTCQGKGAGGENACAGQGACASVAAHDCAGQNQCKGQGGCGNNPGQNACQGMGNCAVPLMDEAWKTARQNFEAAMQGAGKEVGAAPPKS